VQQKKKKTEGRETRIRKKRRKKKKLNRKGGSGPTKTKTSGVPNHRTGGRTETLLAGEEQRKTKTEDFKMVFHLISTRVSVEKETSPLILGESKRVD